MSGDRLAQINDLGEFIGDWTLTHTGRSIGTVKSAHLAEAILDRLRAGSVSGDTTPREQCTHNAPAGFAVVHHVRCTRCGSMGSEGEWPGLHDELLHAAPAAEDGKPE